MIASSLRKSRSCEDGKSMEEAEIERYNFMSLGILFAITFPILVMLISIPRAALNRNSTDYDFDKDMEAKLDASLLRVAKGNKIPKSFVFSRTKLPSSVKQPQMELRKFMLPYIAFSLKEKKRNTLKNFLNVSGPMDVTHFLMLSKTASALSLRVARTPQGLTLTFKSHQYALASDIAQSQLRPICRQDLFKRPPFVIINLNPLSVNFFRADYGSESGGDEEAATVTLSSDLDRVNWSSSKSAVKLQEIGPKMTM